MSKFRQSRRLIGDKNFKPHTAGVAGILNHSTRIIQQRTIQPVARKTVSQEAWLPAPGLVCKHLRSFWRKVSILRRLQKLSSVLLDKSKQILTSVTNQVDSQGSTAADQGVPQMRLGRSRHSLQAASEAQNLQPERSANVLYRHRRALSFLRGQRSSSSSSELSTQQILVPVSPLTQISSSRSCHRPAVSETRWPRKKPKNKQKRKTS